MQQAVLMANGPELLLHQLPDSVQKAMLAPIEETPILGDSLHEQRDLAERGVIHRALKNSGFNRTRAADALGISRVTLNKQDAQLRAAEGNGAGLTY